MCECLCVSVFYNCLAGIWLNEFFIYSSSSVTSSVTELVADPDEDDRIGPDNLNNDDTIPPNPAELPPLASPPPPPPPIVTPIEPPPPCPPPEEPLKAPPKPPNEPLKLPIFDVMAEILGVITDEINVWKLFIGCGDSMWCCLFLAIFAWSNVSIKCVFASINELIFYMIIDNTHW